MTTTETADRSKSPEGSGAMFDGIAHRYDLVNRVISLGIDQSWRKKTVRSLELRPGARVLDLATGTGDLAIMVSRMHPEVTIVGVDPSARMLEVGQKKLTEAALSERIQLQVGDAQALKFPDNSFDGLCIAFGIRNVPDRLQGLREMARVTKAGGRVAILELSEPRGGVLGPLARFHVHSVVPAVGALLSGAKEYRYLQKSIAAFPPAAEFEALMVEAGMRVVSSTALTFGVCHLYVGEPIV
jgi:demethylmenaquinone methyltransferase / 2-methoxy-6-polyprenyl-1,4-benzoquinol methylase